jgi:hypothetical protein
MPARQLGQALEQAQQLQSPLRTDLRDDSLLMQRLKLGGMLQKGTAAGREAERVCASIGVGLAPSDEASFLEIGDSLDEIRLLNAEGGGYTRLTCARVLIDQYQYGKLAGPQVEALQGVIEIREYHNLRPAQCVAHVAAEWRQLHSFPRTTNRMLPAPGRSFGRVRPFGQYCRAALDKTRRRESFLQLNGGKQVVAGMQRTHLAAFKISILSLKKALHPGLPYITYNPNELAPRNDCLV